MQVDVERRSDGNGNVRDSIIRLVKGGTVQGDNKYSSQQWPTSDQVASYGGPSDLWGLSISPQDVNDSNFGVVVSANNLGGGATDTAYVDYISMTVYYTMVEADALVITAEMPHPSVTGGALAEPPSVSLSSLVASPAISGGAVVRPPEFHLPIALTPSLPRVIGIEDIRERQRLRVVYLVEVALGNSGPTLYMSDKNIIVAGQRYEDFIDSVRGIEEEVRRSESASLNTDITIEFKNEAYGQYEHLIEIADTYPLQSSKCIIREVFLDDDGAVYQASDGGIVFSGNLDSPSSISQNGFQCKASARPHYLDRRWRQDVVDTAYYANSHEDVGEVIQLIYGRDILVPALRTDWGVRTTLAVTVDSSQTTGITLSDSTVGPGLPAQGSVIIDNEEIAYTGISSNVLTGVTRGSAGTTSAPHRLGAEVWQKMEQYDSVFMAGECHSAGDIFAEIDGRRHRVTSGVSAVVIEGRHYVRATGQIKAEAVKEDIGISQAFGSSSKRIHPASGDSEVRDQSPDTFITLALIHKYYDFSSYSFGSVVEQQAYFDLENTDTSTQYVYIKMEGGDQLVIGVPPGVRTTVRAMKSGGAWDDYAEIYAGSSGNVRLYRVYKDVFYSPDSGARHDTATRVPIAGDSNARDGSDDTSVTLATSNKTFTYPSDDLGPIVQQHHCAKVNNTTGSTVFVTITAPSGTIVSGIPAGVQTTIRLLWVGGDWGDSTSVRASSSGSVELCEVWKEVLYESAGGIAKTGGIVDARNVDRFLVRADGFMDTTGDYGGVGSVIERPDRVIKHFLTERMGFDSSEIDDASFASAGAAYASAVTGGYTFAFAVTERIRPSEFLERMAFECRSVLRYIKGRWRLDFIPDTAPLPVKTITNGELAGRYADFVFDEAGRGEVANELTARYRRNYAPGPGQSPWDATVSTSDAASVSTYGLYPKSMDLSLVRSEDMARSVLSHWLTEWRSPLRTVRLTVFWDHFDLEAGDTFEIDGPLYGGSMFFVERFRRLDKHRAEIQGRAWW